MFRFLLCGSIFRKNDVYSTPPENIQSNIDTRVNIMDIKRTDRRPSFETTQIVPRDSSVLPINETQHVVETSSILPPVPPQSPPPSNEIENCEYKDTIPFVVPVSRGKVIKVYDGDTFTLASKLPYNNSPLYRFSVRMNGIDSPEIKGKTAKEKELAVASRDALKALIMNQMVELRNVNTEKYGRILADVYIGELCINTWMIDNNYALRYDGGTKMRPEEWDN
jgi:endonuclease YncB( thermonuclease family)